MELDLNRENRRPLYLQVVEQIKARIEHGALPAGTRLPPVRHLADQLGLTRLTVHNAYAELQADGWIESFVGRGSFVAQRADRFGAVRVAPQSASATTRPGELADLLQLAQRPELISFAQAAPAPETFPTREFARAVQQVLKHSGDELYSYGPSQGDQLLRDQLAVYLLDRGVQVPPEQIVVVGGAQQGIDVTLRALVSPGDTVLVEEPTYLGIVERMALQGLDLKGIPLDADGIRIDALEQAIRRYRPRLLYTVPTFHNPTGATMSPARQAAVAELARQYGLLILEDDIYGELSYHGPAPLPLRARDPSVIYLTSFSKSFLPGLRIGLLAVPPHLLTSIVAAKRLTDCQSPQLTQRALAVYLRTGHFAAHLRTVRSLYRERRDALLAHLARTFPAETHWTTPEGGLSLWVSLPPGIRPVDLYLQALERGVAFAPGEAFFVAQPATGHFRLSWGAQPPEQIAAGIATLGKLLHEQVARSHHIRAGSQHAVVPVV